MMDAGEAGTNVFWIDDARGVARAKLGGKLRSLVELSESGFPVPPGFGVSSDTFAAFSAQSGLRERVEEVSTLLADADLGETRGISAELTELVRSAEMPREIEQDIRAAYDRLAGLAGVEHVPVAVRSSGVLEDLEGASFAGQYETYLWIRGADNVVKHVQRCWEGVFSPEVLTYRPSGEVAGSSALAGMAVVVQRMVDAHASGVAFTLDPVTGDRSKIVIESCWGLGEGVVKGDITPDRFRIDKVTMELLGKEISVQDREYRFDPDRGEVRAMELDPERGALPSLDPQQAAAIAALAKQVERDRGGPQDLEWALEDNGEPRLLQARPETVWAQRQREEATKGKSTSAMERVLGTFVKPGGSEK